MTPLNSDQNILCLSAPDTVRRSKDISRRYTEWERSAGSTPSDLQCTEDVEWMLKEDEGLEGLGERCGLYSKGEGNGRKRIKQRLGGVSCFSSSL